MKRHGITRALAALAVTGTTALGAIVIGAGSASASPTGYGQGTLYQVDSSANATMGSFWFWGALDGSPGDTSGTLTYQETDCIHLGGGHATDAAAHDAGSAGWSTVINPGYLTITGVNIIANALTTTIEVPLPSGSTAASALGHSSGLIVTVTAVNIPIPHLPPVGASFTFPAGPSSENQIAP